MNYMILTKEDALSAKIEQKLRRKIKHTYDAVQPDYVIAVGGDGTILRAVHLYPAATIFGLHTGHLGFFANYTKEDLDLLIADINSNRFETEELDQLFCTIKTKEKELKMRALNEITIMLPRRTLILDVKIDDETLERFRGTGFCISTPFGSTAYNKSLHGAVVDPTLKAMQLTEIAGINSNAYRTLSSPLLLSSDRLIELRSEEAQTVFVTVDHESFEINAFEKIMIQYERKKVRMAYHYHPNFIKRIKRTFF